MAEQLITNATGAVASKAVHLRHGESATIVVTGTLGAAETIPVQLSGDGAATFADYYSLTSQIQLTTTNTAITMEGPCVFRMNKGVTSAACGVAMSTANNP